MKYDENGYYGNKRIEDNIDNITALHALFDHKIPTRINNK